MWEARDRLQEISVCKYIWHRKQCFAFSNIWVITEVCTWVYAVTQDSISETGGVLSKQGHFRIPFSSNMDFSFPPVTTVGGFPTVTAWYLQQFFFVPLECCAPFWCQYLSNTFLKPSFQEGNNGRSNSFLGGTHTGNHAGFLRYWRLLI